MRSGVIMGVMIAGALLLATSHASAQTSSSQNAGRSRAPAVSLSEAQNAAQSSTQRSTPAARRGLRWYDTGRWGLNFNMNEPVGREAEWGDVEAGAYYRVNPRLRVGASAGLAAPEQDPARAAETDRRAQPRLRLESIFKF